MRTNLTRIPESATLLGRETQLQMLRAWLDTATPSCAIVGAAGVGKTALLRTFASDCMARGDTGCDELWWVDVAGVATLESLVKRIATTCGITLPDSEDARVIGGEMVRALTTRGRVLLILDGSHRIVLHEREHLPEGAFDNPAIKWVLTARVSTGIAQSRIFVPPLAPEPSQALLIRSAQSAGVDPDTLPAEDLAGLAEQLDRMPLALEMAGRWLLTMSPQQLASALDKYPQFVASDDEMSGVRMAIEEAWRRAEPILRDTALRLAAVDTDVTVEMVAHLCEVGVPEAARRVERLQWLSILYLARSGGHRRFSMFAAVRRAIVDRVDAEQLRLWRSNMAAWIVAESDSWPLSRRREDTATIEWAFAWTVEHDGSLAARLALANMALAEHGEAFGPSLDQLYAALQRVIDGGPAFAHDSARLYLAIGRAHILARDASGAFEALEQAEALSGGDTTLDARIACIRGRAHLLVADFGRARSQSHFALSALSGNDALAFRAMALGTLATVAMEELRLEDAKRFLHTMEREAEWRGTATDTAIANALSWRIATATGALEEVRTERPVGVSGRIIADYWFNAGEANLLMGRYVAAEEAFQQILVASGLDHDVRAVLLRGVGRAVVDTASARLPPDSQPLAALTRFHTTYEWHYPETRSRLFWGVLLALEGNMAAAWRQLAHGLETCQRAGMHLHLGLFWGVAAIVARKAGELEAWQKLGLEEPRGALLPVAAGRTNHFAHRLAAGEDLDEEVPTTWLELVAKRIASSQTPLPAETKETQGVRTLEIGPSWRWMKVDGGEESSLVRRHSGRRILQRLVEQHARSPGAKVERQELIDVGWPEERMMAESALARFNTTMWRLRQMGLAQLLVSEGTAYGLELGTVVVMR